MKSTLFLVGVALHAAAAGEFNSDVTILTGDVVSSGWLGMTRSCADDTWDAEVENERDLPWIVDLCVRPFPYIYQ